MTTAEGIVVMDVPCTKCGYNLRTLPVEARCPECGEPVMVSLESTVVRWGVKYVLQIARAATVAGGLNAAAIGLTLLFVIGMFLSFMTRANDPTILVVLLFMSYVGIALLHAGTAMMLTLPPPGKAMEMEGIVIRVAGFTFAAATIVPLVFASMTLSSRPPLDGLIYFLLAAWTTLLPSLSIFVFFCGRRFARLCKEAGMHSLVGWHRWASWILAAGVGMMNVGFLMATVMVVFVLPAMIMGPPPMELLTAMQFLLWGGLLIAGAGYIMATVLLFRTAHKFRIVALLMGAPPKPEPPMPSAG